MAQIKVKKKNIKEVSKESLKGLSLIMKGYGNVSLEGCFGDCKGISTLDFPPTFNTSKVRDTRWMFCGCSSLRSVDLSTFNTSSVTDMSHMFEGCINLSSLDLSTFNTSSVTDMSRMFYGCKGLTSLDLSTFNTSSVTGTYAIFCGCSSLKSLDLSTFDTSSVESDGTWSGCTCMFQGCSRLEEVYVKDERIKSKLRRGVTVRTK